MSKKADFDFNFICAALGLMQIQDGMGAINPASIVSINLEPTGHYVFTLQGDSVKYALSHEQMAELENTIKRKAEESKIIQKEAIRNQFMAQQEVVNELNRGIQGGAIIAAGLNKKGRN